MDAKQPKRARKKPKRKNPPETTTKSDRVFNRTLAELRKNFEPSDGHEQFPLDVFPGEIAKFVSQAAAALPCPPDYVGLPLLVVIGSHIGPHRPLKAKNSWQQYPSIYGAIVGETGSLKTPALDLVLEPARKRDKELQKQYQRELKEHEKQVRLARKNNAEPPPKPQPRQLLTTDTTIESLADVLGNNPDGVLIYRDELTGWVRSLNQYKGGKGADREFWLSAWSSQDYTVNRKGQDPLRITKPFISVVGCLPPDMVADLAERHGREDGFLDRILFAFPDPVPVRWTDADIPPQAIRNYSRCCNKVAKLPPATLELSPAARDEFEVWYNAHNAEQVEAVVRGSWAKLNGYCLRFANILHHLHHVCGETNQAEIVGEETIKKAIDLVTYFKSSIRRTFNHMNADKSQNRLARVLSLIHTSRDNKVRGRDLQVAKIAKNSEQATELLEQLARYGLGTIARPRRDSVVFTASERLRTLYTSLGEDTDADAPTP